MNISEGFKALADSSRVNLAVALRGAELNVQELTQITGLSQSMVSHHLRLLQQGGIVKQRREGTWVYYSLVSADDSAPTEVGPILIRALDELVDIGAVEEAKDLNREVSRAMQARGERSLKFFESKPEQDLLVGNSGLEAVPLSALHSAVPSEGVLLDLGCGDGLLLEKLLPRKGSIVAVDYSKRMVQRTKQRLKPYGAAVQVKQSQIEGTDLKDRSVDVALLSMVLHHAAEPLAVLREARRVLKTKGKLVVIDLLKHGNEKFRNERADLWLGFEPTELKRELSKLGFVRVKSKKFKESNAGFLLECFKG